jgi:catalase
VFFIRDPIKFPDMVHAFKPDPITNRQSNQRFFDFVSMSPEATHMITHLFSPWGIPATYREMQGSGVNTYKLVNEDGRTQLCKFHFQPRQGVRNLLQSEAEAIQAKDFNHATGDLYDSIERGEFPEWDMFIQVMDDHEHPELDWDPLDVTKLWPEDQFPLRHVGHIQLNRNPVDYHNEVEQVAFGTGVLVDGIDFSEDKLLQGRTFAYSDTQRYRVGPNYLQLPINAPKCPFATNQRGGQMSYHVDGAEQGADPHVNYEPSNFEGLREQERTGAPPRTHWAGEVGRQRIERTNDFAQAGERYRSYEDWEREELISNLVGALSECAPVIQEKMIRHFTLADPDYGRRVAEGLGRSLSSAAAE